MVRNCCEDSCPRARQERERERTFCCCVLLGKNVGEIYKEVEERVDAELKRAQESLFRQREKEARRTSEDIPSSPSLLPRPSALHSSSSSRSKSVQEDSGLFHHFSQEKTQNTWGQCGETLRSARQERERNSTGGQPLPPHRSGGSGRTSPPSAIASGISSSSPSPCPGFRDVASEYKTWDPAGVGGTSGEAQVPSSSSSPPPSLRQRRLGNGGSGEGGEGGEAEATLFSWASDTRERRAEGGGGGAVGRPVVGGPESVRENEEKEEEKNWEADDEDGEEDEGSSSWNEFWAEAFSEIQNEEVEEEEEEKKEGDEDSCLNAGSLERVEERE